MTTDAQRSSLALDVGGANVKFAHSDGSCGARAFALWKQPGELPRVLDSIAAALPRFDGLLLTMTAELCDCFANKAEGVRFVVHSVRDWAGPRAMRVWGTDGRFHEPAAILEAPAFGAASNWLALAHAVARRFPDRAGILIDVGSTTTDLIPFQHGQTAAVGRTDRERLARRALVYAGVRRTPLAALASELPFDSASIGIAAEFFATTHDLFLILECVAENPDDNDTADGQPATRIHAEKRLARMIATDREDLSSTELVELARAFQDVLLARLAAAAQAVARSAGHDPEVVVLAGSGEFLARQVADRAGWSGTHMVSLAEVWDHRASTAACARALLELDRDSVDRSR